MAHTEVTKTHSQNTGVANTFSYSGSFDVFKGTEVVALLNNVKLTYTATTINESADPRQYTVDTSAKTIHIGGADLSSGTIIIRPETDLGSPTPRATYAPGSSITSADLNNNQTQLLRRAMEYEQQGLMKEGGTMSGDLTMGEDTKIIFEGATDNAHETTLTVVDPTADRTITIPNVTGTVVTTGDTATVTATMMAANSVDSSELVDGGVDASHLASHAVTEAKIQLGAVTRDKLGADCVTAEKIQDDAINSEHITAGALDNEHYAAASIDSTKLTGATVVTAAEQAGATANDTSFFTSSASDARYFNVTTGDTIKDGETFPDNDSTIATTAAINDRIIDLVDDVGGFVPIANETSFPNANPDVNNGAGTLISIKALASNLTSNSSGVATIANGNVGNSATVTINDLANSTTYSAGVGILVETTTTLHTYSFHRQIPGGTDVSTVAGSISNVNTVAGAIANVNTVAGDISNINAVAADATDIGVVAGKATEIGRLGTADAVADMNTLGTAAIVEDMNLLGTSACVEDMSLLGTSAVIADMATIADTTDLISNIGTVAGAATNVNNVGGSIANVNTVATNLTGVNSFGDTYQVATSAPTARPDSGSLTAGDLWFDSSSNKTMMVYDGSSGDGYSTVSPTQATIDDLAICAGNLTLTENLGLITDAVDSGSGSSIDTVADNIANVNRLGTSDAVADMALLGTTDCVADMAILGTSAIVEDLGILGTSANVTAMANCSGSISNINTTSGSISNVNTVASSIADVNRYANEYKIASSAPGSPSEGDLWYDSSNNVLKYRDDNSWESISAGLANIVEDTSPQLGGALDAQSNNITSAGSIAATSLDISGDVDIDGTCEADAYTVNGTALNEYIADTVGAMVGSNTETNIAVTYEDSDNTLDFVVTAITGNAGSATVLETARNIGGVSFNGSANINLPGVNAAGNQNTSGTAAGLSGSPDVSLGTVTGDDLQIDFGSIA